MTHLKKYARWAEWEAAVLSKVKDPQKCQQVILGRQREVDDDQDEADLVSKHIREKLREGGLNPETCCVFIRSSRLAEWISELDDKKMSQTRVTPYLKCLSIPELRQATRKAKAAGWIWLGQKSKKTAQAADLEKLKYMPPDD